MIRESTIKLATDIATAASYSGKYLGPKKQGPIDMLLETISVEFVEGTNEDIMRASNNTTSLYGNHGDLEGDLAIKYSTIVSNIVNAARNVVKPLVSSIVDEIKDSTMKEGISSTGLYKEIVQVTTPRLFYDDQFLQLITEFKDISYPELSDLNTVVEFLDKFTVNDLYGMSMTGSAVLDGKLSEIYKEDDFNTLLVFLDGKFKVSADEIPMKLAIMLFMLAWGIINRRSDKIEDTLSPEINLKILTIRNGLGGAICRLTDMFFNDLEKGVLFCIRSKIINKDYFSVDIDPTKIYVYSKPYSDWISNGGSVEALLGYASEKPIGYGSDDLLESPQKYVEIYNRKLKSLDIVKQLTDIKNIRAITLKAMERYINLTYGRSPEGLECFARLAHAIEHDYHGTGDLIPYVIKVVSRTLYPDRFSAKNEINKSDVKEILLEIYALVSNVENPNYDEALTIATIRMVGRKLKDELVVIK